MEMFTLFLSGQYISLFNVYTNKKERNNAYKDTLGTVITIFCYSCAQVLGITLFYFVKIGEDVRKRYSIIVTIISCFLIITLEIFFVVNDQESEDIYWKYLI